MPTTIRYTEFRRAALRLAADQRLSFQSGMALSGGSYHAELLGCPGETTTSKPLKATVTDLVAKGYLRHQHPGVPARSGAVLLTDSGRALLTDWNKR